MVRWFMRSGLRLVSSRKDEQDRAVDHRSLEDTVVVVSHGTDHNLELCVYHLVMREFTVVWSSRYRGSKSSWLEVVVQFGSEDPTSYSRGDYAHIREFWCRVSTIIEV